MAQVSQRVRGRILPPSPIDPEVVQHEQEKQHALALRCRPSFERLRPSLIETHYNWYIAIDPESENYLLDKTLIGIMQQIENTYSGDEVKLTIFRLNNTGTCGRLWV
jgi:hypothetical protein